jgi:hypothetical protein
MQPIDDFARKTHAHLASLLIEAALIRRNMPRHPACSDQAACKPCAALRDIHERVNDHLDQLREHDVLVPLDFLEPA